MISIIIPIFNVESFLRRCLESIALQKIYFSGDLEVILINDGSTDGSLLIAKDYSVRFGWKLIDQDNQGLSIARNIGLEYATGDYVWFVDSDDRIAEDSCQILNDAIVDQDVISFGYSVELENGNVVKTFLPDAGFKTGKEALLSQFSIQAPFYIFNRQFLLKNRLSFFPKIYHEDFEFSPRMLFFAHKYSSLDKILYFVFKRPNSITTTLNPKRAYDYLKVINSLMLFCETLEEGPVKTKFADLISLGLNNSLKCSSSLSGTVLRDYFDLIHDLDFVDYLINSSKFKYMAEGFILKYFPFSIWVFRAIQV